MSNFYRQRVARESAGTDAVVNSLSDIVPAEENLDQQLVELASGDQQLEALDRDGQVLSDDIERTEAAVGAAETAVSNGEELSEETVAQVEVAQESIRRRWCRDQPKLAVESYRRSRGLTAAAREGWREVLKDLWQRFIDLCKTIRGKIKDLTLKYFNAGKAAQKRAKEYQERIRKLGKSKKDEVSGSFITKLSVNGKFELDASIAIAKAVVGGKGKELANTAIAKANEAVIVMEKAGDGGELVFKGENNAAWEAFGNASTTLKSLPEFEDAADQGKVLALPGNAYMQVASKKLSAGGAEVGDLVALAFTTTGDAAEDKTIETPKVPALTAAASALDIIGKGYEKLLKDFRGYEAALEKLEREAEKLVNKFNKATEDADREKFSASRTIADQNVRNLQTAYRATNYVANGVLAGLNGFLGTGIGAYESK